MTPAAVRLTQSARTVMSELDAAGSDVRALLEGREGTLRITTECLQSYRWLPAAMKTWARTHPKHMVRVVAEAGESPLEALHSGQVDLALVVGRRARDARLNMTRLFRDELVALVGRQHRLASKRQVDVKTFAAEPYWGSEESHGPETPLGRALARAGVGLSQATSMPMSSGVPLEMTRANLAVTMCPRWFVARELARGDFSALRIGRGLWLEWFVVTRSVDITPATRAFVEVMRRQHP